MIRPLILALAATVVPATADVRLPKVFTDGAVLQRDRPLPVWGHASPGKKVIVKFAGQEKSAVADPDTTWSVQLDPLPRLDAHVGRRALDILGHDVLENVFHGWPPFR